MVLRILKWILYIGLSILSGWFSSGVLQHFFSHKKNFSQHEEKVTHYPVVTIVLNRQASEVKIADVEIYYYTIGMTTDYKGYKLEIGENQLYNYQYNKTDKVILDSPQKLNRKRAFRIIQTTPILQKNLPDIGIELYQNVENKTKTLLSDFVSFCITSPQNSPGFTYGRWKDGKPLINAMNKNTWMAYNIQPQMTKAGSIYIP